MRDAKGRFLPGPDPDRHILTRLDCQKGYMVVTQRPLKALSKALACDFRASPSSHIQCQKSPVPILPQPNPHP